MKSTIQSLGFLAAATFVVGLVACANSTAPIPDDFDGGAGTTGTSTSATEPTGTSSAGASSTSNNKTCVSKCNVDSDCANSCPAVAAASQCCDTSTGVCFSSPGSTCPVPAASDDDAGSPSSGSTPSY